MDREPWRDLTEAWQRLRWARAEKFESQKDAAAALGMKPGTYSAYERPPGSSKWINLDHQAAMHMAKTFKVRWQWLLLGEGEPRRKSRADRVAEVLEAMSEEDQERLMDVFEAFARKRA